jgi:uncharacterized protein YjdB
VIRRTERWMNVVYTKWNQWLSILLTISLLFGLIAVAAGTEVHAEELEAGDIAHESFDNVVTGAKPSGSGWSYKEIKGSISVAEVPDEINKSLKIERTETDTVGNVYARKVLDSPLTGPYIVRSKVMAEQTNAILIGMQLRSSDSHELATIVFTQDGNIRYQLASGSVIMQPYSSGKWYDIATLIDTDTQQYSVFIDGEKKAGPLSFKNSAAGNLKQVDLQVFRTTTGTAYWDDFDIYTLPQGGDVPISGITLPTALTLYTGESKEITAELDPFYATSPKVTWVSSKPSVVSVVYDVYGGAATLTGLQAGESIVTAVSEDGAYSDSSLVTVKAGGDVFNERFDSYTTGTKPSTLSIPTVTGVSAVVAEVPNAADKSLRIEKLEATASSYNISKTLPAGITKMKVSLKARVSQTDAVVYASIIRNTAGSPVVYVAFHSNGTIAVMDNGSWKSIQPYETNRWYQFDLALNTATDQYDLFIDGVPKGYGLNMLVPADELRNVQFGMYGLSAGTAYFDELQYFGYQAVTGMQLTDVPSMLSLGSKLRLKADFEPTVPTFTAVQWSSSDPSVVAIDELGNASAEALGHTVITAVSVDGAFTASANVQVYEQEVQGVILDSSTITLPEGSDRKLTASVLPLNSSNQTISWSSNNPSVATVNEEGIVHAIGEGTAQIIVTTQEGSYTAAATVTVIARTVQTSYYVSPSGSDSNPGSLTQPFQTIEEARDRIRAINSSMTGDIVVYLREGSYNQQATLLFDERDSGSNGYWVVYKAFEEERPVIEGGEPITGWTLHDPVNNIYKAAAGSDIETRQLYVNGIRAIRARSEGGLTNPVKNTAGYTSDDTTLAGWGNITDLEFVYKAEWTNPRIAIQSAAVENGKAVITMKQPGWNYVTVRPSVVNPWYLENAYELLDEAGEWYLDRGTDIFYYKPRPGENMSTAGVVAPVIEELVKIQGTTLDTPVDGIHFEGLTFNYTTWLRPSSDMGHADAQNNLLRYGIDTLPMAAITVEKASHIQFERNEFSKLGIMAIKMVNGVRDSLIRGNRFFDISGGAINVGDPTKHDPEIYNPSDPRKLLRNVDIVNNYIHDIGVDYRSSAAIGAGFVVDMDISHNEIFNVPYDGITIGYGLAHVKTSALRNAKLHANFIHDIMGEQIYDGGAIYTLGGTGGTAENKNQITENYLRNQMNRYGVIYNDEGSTYWKSERNVIDVSETPIWDEIFPATWGFVNGALTSHDITFDTNYTTTANVKTVGTDVYEINTQVYPDAQWPAEALAIIANSGLEPEYRDIAQATPERIVLPKKLDLTTGGSYTLDVTATTGKDQAIDLSGASIYYSSEDEGIAQVDAAGEIEAIASGATRIWVHVEVDQMLWKKSIPVYVDDEFDAIEVYYVENKAKHLFGEAYSLLRGDQRQLYVDAKSLYGQQMTVSQVTYTSSDPQVMQMDSQGKLTALAVGSANIEFSLVVGGVTETRTIEFTVSHFGDPAGLEYDAYPIDDVIGDTGNWYVYASGSGNQQSDEDSITIVTPSGFATYQGDTFEDELLTMDMQINANDGWPSLVLRSQQPDEAFTSATNDLYLICFKNDVIELHRFNGGERTVIYGNIAGYTSIGGSAIPNNFIPFHELHRVQVGAVNESGGVRLILNIDGENVFYFLDTAAERLEDPGYFGLYARSGSITLQVPEME